MPIPFVKQIDMVRGDICRSRFVLRAVEKYLKDSSKENRTEVVGHPTKTTHNLQDVACHRKTHRISIGNGEGLNGCEHQWKS
jgi:hypothetical protein